MSRLEIVFIVGSLLNVAAVIELVRRRRMHEGFAVLWVAVGIAGLVFALARPLFDRLARALGVTYGANLFLALGFMLLLFVCVALSIVINRLEERVELLAEEVTFLRGVTEPFDVGTRER